jgi:hypothetical protein
MGAGPRKLENDLPKQQKPKVLVAYVLSYIGRVA